MLRSLEHCPQCRAGIASDALAQCAQCRKKGCPACMLMVDYDHRLVWVHKKRCLILLKKTGKVSEFRLFYGSFAHNAL